jgi:hypothetical protein
MSEADQSYAPVEETLVDAIPAPEEAEPIAEAVVEEPVVEEPVVEEPVVEEPAVEEPAVEEPAVEEPVAEEPVAEEPVAAPAPKPVVISHLQGLKIVNQAEIKAAFDAIRSDADPMTWLFLSYTPGKRDQIELVASGSGEPIAALRAILDDTMVGWGLLRYSWQLDQARREKFVGFTLSGDKAKVMAKAVMNMHKSAIVALWGHIHTELTVGCPEEELTEKELKDLVLRSGGAMYDRATM